MSSKLFREELERVVTDSLRDSGADGLSNILGDMMSTKKVRLDLTYETIRLNKIFIHHLKPNAID